MTATIPTIKLFTSKDDTGIHINSLILEHNGNNYHLNGGTGDPPAPNRRPITIKRGH